jgi:hypothetical protein
MQEEKRRAGKRNTSRGKIAGLRDDLHSVRPIGHFAQTRATNPAIRCMHCTHSTFSPCCAPGRATNPAIRCIAWVIFPIFAQARATNPAIRCIAWGIFPIFAQTRATNPAIRCIASGIFPILPFSARRILGSTFSGSYQDCNPASQNGKVAHSGLPIFPLRTPPASAAGSFAHCTSLIRGCPYIGQKNGISRMATVPTTMLSGAPKRRKSLKR